MEIVAYNKKIDSLGISSKLYKDSWAKPTGINLYDHTFNVICELESILNERIRTLDKYERLNEAPLNIEELHKIIILHDYGKVTNRWQEYVKSNNLQNVRYRHEIGFFHFYIKNPNDFIDDIETIVPIIAHHNNLSYDKVCKFDSYGDDFITDIKPFQRIYNFYEITISQLLTLKVYSYEVIKSKLKKDGIKFFYNLGLKRHYLQLADRRASAKESGFPVEPIISLDKSEDFYKINPNWELRKLQEICDTNSDELLILRAPTGSGKTSACLLWANNQFKHNKCERLIITMPTQFTSNALADNISKEDGLFLKRIAVQHSGKRFDSKSLNERIHSNTFEEVINVCTIDQVLYAFNLASEQHKSAAFNIANSCVVIDESDFYDNFILRNIIELLKILKELKVPVMFMSATLPDSFVDLINQELGTNLKMVDDDSDLSRERCCIHSIVDGDQAVNLIKQCKDKPQAIIYCNTIKRAKEAYNILLKECPERSHEIVLYHSEFLRSDKESKEEKILSLLGREGTGRGVIIMTQIGELSINISSNYILSDICPIDRLVQRLGRGCRFDKNICDVDIVIPFENGEFYPAPYGLYDTVKKKWTPLTSLSKTKNLLKAKGYSGADYIQIINQVYQQFNFNHKAIKNSRLLKENFESNIVFNHKYKIDEYDAVKDEGFWKSRNIMPQVKVIVGEIPESFGKQIEFDKFVYDNSLGISSHKIRKYEKEGIIFKMKTFIEQNGDSQEVFCISEGNYNNSLGIIV